ncbi:MAG TPA: glycosyltransferase family 4 protein [Isosphaeraceae bacterium]|nr:glycosyltransferase family 4 protein [Isosphaeraceae bacterium]
MLTPLVAYALLVSIACMMDLLMGWAHDTLGSEAVVIRTALRNPGLPVPVSPAQGDRRVRGDVQENRPRRARPARPGRVREGDRRWRRSSTARKIDEFTRAIGWQSQAELPRHYREADFCLVPTIAQDGLSITSVEAMAAEVPVIASRIGGVPFTVTDGVTGLLCEPGDPVDLAAKIARLLDDPELRHRMGVAGRRRFEADFTWETVIERYWRPLLKRRAAASST